MVSSPDDCNDIVPIKSLKRKFDCLSDSLLEDDDNNVVTNLLEIYDSNVRPTDVAKVISDDVNIYNSLMGEVDDVLQPYGFSVRVDRGPNEFMVPKPPVDPSHGFCSPMGARHGGRSERSTAHSLRTLSEQQDPTGNVSSVFDAAQVGKFGSRCNGTERYQTWSRDSFQGRYSASFQRCDQFVAKNPVSGLGVSSGTKRFNLQGCCNTGSSAPKRGRVLQPLFSGSQAGRGNASYSESETFQQECEKDFVQNDQNTVSAGNGQTDRFSHVHRPERCFFPLSGSGQTQEIPEVLLPRGEFSIQLSPVRLSPLSNHVHTVRKGGTRGVVAQGASNCLVPRRFASVGTIAGAVYSQHARIDGIPEVYGVQRQLEKERALASVPSVLSGPASRHSDYDSDYYTGALGGYQTRASAVRPGWPNALQDGKETAGSFGISAPGCSSRSAVYEKASIVVREGAQEIRRRSASQQQIDLGSYRGFTGSGPLEQSLCRRGRCSDGAQGSGDDDLHRCVSLWMGRSDGLQHGARCVATGPQAAHQRVGDDGDLVGSATIRSESPGPSHTDYDRQRDSQGLYQPPGRSEVGTVQGLGPAHLALGLQPRALHQGTSCSRGEQRSRGYSLEGRPSRRQLESESRHTWPDLGQVRRGSGGPICVESQRQVSTMVFSVSDRRGSDGGQRARTGSMAGGAALRVPSLQVPAGAFEQVHAHGGEDDSRGPVRGEQRLVSPDGALDPGRALRLPAVARRSDAGQRADLGGPLDQGLQISGMDAYKARLLALGLCEHSVEVMQAARKCTTNSRYQGYWKCFVAFCARRRPTVNPYEADIVSIIRFVEECRRSRRWTFSSVKLCVSAITAFRGKIGDVSVFTHPLMKEYLRGADRLSADRITRAEVWDASLVLRALQDEPFEPMATAEIKWVSAKLAVLLALTTAARGSELAALTIRGLVFSTGDVMATVYPDPAFVPKTVTELYRRAPMVIRAFHPSPVTGEEERLHLLCPVRALRCYLERTSPFRQSDRLLVTYAVRRPGFALSSQRLAHWLVDGITEAYVRSNKPAPRLTAHSTRGTAVSIAVLSGVDWEVVRQAAAWLGDRTFLSHYFRNTAVNTVAEAVLRQAC